MSNDYYKILGISKNTTKEDIKKAYRKQAMKYHPDRNAGDKSAEKKFKEVNEAYSVLSDAQKKKQYDMFGKTGGSFNTGGAGGGGFGGFEDMFGAYGGNQRGGQNGGFEFNMEDLFGGMGGKQRGNSYSRQEQRREPISLDFEKTYEVPIFDLILGCKIEVKGVYGNIAKLKIPASTKPGTKFRVKGFGKKEPGKEGNLIIKIEALMPKNISDVDMQMLKTIRDNTGY